MIRFCFVNSSCSVQSQCLKLPLLYDVSEKPETTSEDVLSARPLVIHHPAFLPCTFVLT